jgi:hypothetical protein
MLNLQFDLYRVFNVLMVTVPKNTQIYFEHFFCSLDQAFSYDE